MPVPARIPYPLAMDEKVYTTIDGQRMTEAEFEAWADKFTDEWANRPQEDVNATWRKMITAPFDANTPTKTITLELSEASLNAINCRAAEAELTQEQFIRMAILSALAK